MKKLFVIFFLFLSVSDIMAQKDSQSIQATVIGFFNGLSLINSDTLKHYTTSDFELLEDGEVWNMDTLVNAVKPLKGSNMIRVNSFNFLTTKIQKDIAWVSYYNTADYTMDEKKRQVRWLESAVLVKTKGRWKIQLLHSTKIK